MTKRTRSRSIATIAVLFLFGSCSLVLAQGEVSGVEVFSTLRLQEAGYSPESQDSLIAALGDDRLLVAGAAARFLGQRPSTPEAVSALKRVLEGTAHEAVVASAAGSLATLRASGWQDEAVRRMREFRLSPSTILLAGFLAQSGRSDGWPVIQEALRENGERNGLAVVAAQSAHAFRGLKSLDGSGPIDVTIELKRALAFHANDPRIESDIARQLARSTREDSEHGRKP